MLHSLEWASNRNGHWAIPQLSLPRHTNGAERPPGCLHAEPGEIGFVT
jgi:hypothetical protein